MLRPAALFLVACTACAHLPRARPTRRVDLVAAASLVDLECALVAALAPPIGARCVLAVDGHLRGGLPLAVRVGEIDVSGEASCDPAALALFHRGHAPLIAAGFADGGALTVVYLGGQGPDGVEPVAAGTMQGAAVDPGSAATVLDLALAVPASASGSELRLETAGLVSCPR